jgi:hypothetical protein
MRKVATGGAATTLERGLRDATGGIDERPREEGVFTSLSLPFSGKTEVLRELDYIGPSTLSNADRPRPVGTPVR